MNTTSTTYAGGARSLARIALPVVVAGGALAIAYVGAFLVRDTGDISGPNLFVESLSGSSSSFFGGLGIVTPLGFAFAAGVASAFNPCGFAMLPAYMGLYLGVDDRESGPRLDILQLGKAILVAGAVTAGLVLPVTAPSWLGGAFYWIGLMIDGLLLIFLLGFAIQRLAKASTRRRIVWLLTSDLQRLGDAETWKRGARRFLPVLQELSKALLVGGTVSAGFVVLFAVAGAVIGFGARSAVGSILPWLGLSIGILLTIVGSWLLAGGKLYTALATQMASRMGNPGRANVGGYFVFGLSYGTASLSCTLPIFLAVVGTSFAVSSIAASFGQFVLYAAGMGFVIMGLTLGMAIFKGAMSSVVRKAMPYIQPVGTWLMIVAGTYIVFYWLTLGDLLDKLS